MWLVKYLRKTVLKHCGFDLFLIKPVESARSVFTKAFFMAAKYDTLVPARHTMEVYKAYGGKKDFALLEGHHNSVRSIFLHNKVGKFFENTLFDQNLSMSRASCGYLTPRLIEPGDIIGDDSEPTEIDDSLKNFCAGD